MPNVRLTGGGTLLGTAEQTSEFFINADNVKVDNLTFKKPESRSVGRNTRRWDSHRGTHRRHPHRCDRGWGRCSRPVHRWRVQLHPHQGACAELQGRRHPHHRGIPRWHLIDCDVTNAGDDGFAMVSYANSTPVNNITITNPKLFGQTWGRAFSVVGGKNITWNNVYAENSNAAAIYVAAEREWNSLPVSNVVFNGGTLKNSNTNSTVDHGAVLIYNSQTGTTSTDISLRNLTLTNTRASASRNVGIINNGGVNQRITMSGFTSPAAHRQRSTRTPQPRPSQQDRLDGQRRDPARPARLGLIFLGGS